MKIWKNRIIVSDPQFDGTKIVNKLWYSCFVSKLYINYGFEKGKLGKRLTLKNSHRYSEAQWVLSCVQNKTKTGSKWICNRTFIPSKVIRKYCPMKKWGNGSVQLHFGRKSLGFVKIMYLFINLIFSELWTRGGAWESQVSVPTKTCLVWKYSSGHPVLFWEHDLQIPTLWIWAEKQRKLLLLLLSWQLQGLALQGQPSSLPRPWTRPQLQMTLSFQNFLVSLLTVRLGKIV